MPLPFVGNRVGILKLRTRGVLTREGSAAIEALNLHVWILHRSYCGSRLGVCTTWQGAELSELQGVSAAHVSGHLGG